MVPATTIILTPTYSHSHGYHTVCMYKHPVYTVHLAIEWLALSVAAHCAVLISHCMSCGCYWLPHAVRFTICCCYLLLHAVQFAICCRMPCGSLFVVAICCCMLYSLLFVAACRAVCYLLPHAVQFAICCHMPYSLLSVATCHTVCIHSHILYSCYLLPNAMQFGICCCMLHSSLFIAAGCTVCYLSSHSIQFLLFVTACNFVFAVACCAVCYLLQHAMQLAICCCTLYSLSFIATPTVQHNLGEIGCSKNCLIISNTNNHNGLSDKVH